MQTVWTHKERSEEAHRKYLQTFIDRYHRVALRIPTVYSYYVSHTDDGWYIFLVTDQKARPNNFDEKFGLLIRIAQRQELKDGRFMINFRIVHEPRPARADA